MKRVSLESEINAIIKNSALTINCESMNIKTYSSRHSTYEYNPNLENELRKRARNMFKKKAERFSTPSSQKVLLVFSKYRGKVNEIVSAVERCRYVNDLYSLDVLKMYLDKLYLKPIVDLGVSLDDAKTLFLNARDISYVLTIMPKAYMS